MKYSTIKFAILVTCASFMGIQGSHAGIITCPVPEAIYPVKKFLPSGDWMVEGKTTGSRGIIFQGYVKDVQGKPQALTEPIIAAKRRTELICYYGDKMKPLMTTDAGAVKDCKPYIMSGYSDSFECD
jgi:hypothetical protein